MKMAGKRDEVTILQEYGECIERNEGNEVAYVLSCHL